MRKKRIKKDRAFSLYLEELERWNGLSEKEKIEESRERAIKRQEEIKRHARYSEQPFRSVRGLNKARVGVFWGGPQNGVLCMACLRRVGDSHRCGYCKSASLVGINSKARLPNKTASRWHWKKFIKNHTRFKSDEFPQDFMRNINKKNTDD